LKNIPCFVTRKYNIRVEGPFPLPQKRKRGDIPPVLTRAKAEEGWVAQTINYQGNVNAKRV